MKYVLIPSAKFAPAELNNYGLVPMVLFPINGFTILSRLYYHYKSYDKIIISSFEGSDLLLKYQKLFPKVNVSVLEEIHDLTHTIFSALTHLSFSDDDDLIINFGDTLVDNKCSGDTILYSHPLDLEKKWTYLKEKNGKIVDIIDKNVSRQNNSDYKLVCGVISVSHPCFFKQLLQEHLDMSISIFDILKEYSQKYPFVFEKAINWHDAGHNKEYYNSSIAIKSRIFNHITIDKNRGILRKTSDNVDKFKNEIEWYIHMPKELSYVVPRVVDYSLDEKRPFVEMEYYPYPTLLELSLYGNFDSSKWESIFLRIRFILNDFKSFKYAGEFNYNAITEMYIDKTIQRISEMKFDNYFSCFFNKSIIINNVHYKSLNQIIDLISEKHFLSKLCKGTDYCVIHGDLCFANILVDDSNQIIKLIDPRGSFGNIKLYGDPCYDLAKLFHSMDGKYDYIIKDLFTINVKENRINISFPTYNPKVFEIFKSVMKDDIYDKFEKIEIIESLLFLSMLPLHRENSHHQFAMLASGIEILARHLDLKEKGND